MTEFANEIIFFAIDVHLFFLILLPLMPLRNLYLVIYEKNFIRMAKGVKFFTPAYFGVIASLSFSGLILAIFVKEYFTIMNLIMSLATIYLIASEIKRVKKLRPIRSDEPMLQEEFRDFAKKKYTFDLLMILVVTILVYIF